MNQYFPKPYSFFGGNIKVGLDLSNHAKNFMQKKQQAFIHQFLTKRNLVACNLILINWIL